MGLAALTRKGWKENPKQQGKINLFVAFLAVIVGDAISYFVYGEMSPIEVNMIFLAWGIISYFLGLFLGHLRKK